jgi:lipid II:glycine glycyltransferase (peptidoglycan interpeptide bridge formation enzyme)
MWLETEDKDKWNNLVGKQEQARFLQSWQWGDFQTSIGHTVRRLNYNDEILAQAIKMPLPFGKFYWYIPHAPVNGSAFNELQKTLGQHRALFLRVDPCSTTPPPTPSSKRRGISSTQPQCVRILDLTKTEAEILAGTHPKTRYNINLAERKGVTIGKGDIAEFLKLNHETSKRDEFTSHPDAYYKKMVKALAGDCEAKIWQASFAGQALASAIVIYFGDTATYAHGASSNEGRNLMAPYLLHWKIIQDAKARGFKFYDLGGVNPVQENHPAGKKSWQGITRFKQGFGGEVVCNPPSFDLIYRPGWYRLYRLLSKVRRLL